MATAAHSRRPRALVVGLAVATTVLSTLSVVTTSGLPAAADPGTDLAQVQAQVEDLQGQADAATERFNGARIELAAVQQRLAGLKARATVQERALRREQRTMGQFARATYTSGGVDASLQLLLADDPSDFLAQAATLDQVARSQSTALRRTQTARLRLAQTQAAVAAAEQAATSVRDQMAAALAEAQGHLDQARQVLDQLQEEERLRLAAQEQARREAAIREARAAAAAQADRDSTGGTRPAVGATAGTTTDAPPAAPADPGGTGGQPPASAPAPGQDAGGSGAEPGQPGQDAGDSGVSGGASGGASQGAGGSSASDGSSGDVSDRAAQAVQYALAQVGDSYVAGAAGPGAFDCSGLTMAAWASAGVSLPHYSGAQWDVTRRVSTDAAQPGDLVFYFGGGAHHVGLYIGGGRMVHAANPGRGVVISGIFGPWYSEHFSGIGRVVG